MSHRQGQTTGSGLLWSLQGETSTSRASRTPPEVNQEVSLQLLSAWYLEGYHRPGINHPDHVVYEIIGLLSDGRTRACISLWWKHSNWLSAQGFSGFPGDKYPNLMLFYALTAPGHTVDQVALALRKEIESKKSSSFRAGVGAEDTGTGDCCDRSNQYGWLSCCWSMR